MAKTYQVSLFITTSDDSEVLTTRQLIDQLSSDVILDINEDQSSGIEAIEIKWETLTELPNGQS